MSDSKKDLTRIEDLGEYLHELSEEEEVPAFLEAELPSTPEEDTPFESTEFTSEDSPTFGEESPTFETNEDETFPEVSSDTFETTTEDSPSFESNNFESTDFNSTNDDFSLDQETSNLTSLAIEENAPASVIEEVPIESFSTAYEEEKIDDKNYRVPETFEDLKKFAESSTPSGMGAEGNPSFSVLLKNIRFIEDINDIILLLKEFSLLTDSEDQVKKRMMRGQLLVPRISEYCAIYLAHKLRRFDIDIQVGLSDEIHPPKHQETPETGIVSKSTLHQNQTHNFQFSESKVDLNQIIVAATPSLDGYQILKYMGVATEHKIIDGQIVEDEASEDIPRYYQELAQKLKAHALKINANAVMGINYQLTPLPSEYGLTSSKFRLSCTGNLVWVNKL